MEFLNFNDYQVRKKTYGGTNGNKISDSLTFEVVCRLVTTNCFKDFETDGYIKRFRIGEKSNY